MSVTGNPVAAIPLATVRDLAAASIAAQPALRTRIEKAVQILTLRTIRPSGRGWLVESEAEPGHFYAVIGHACECSDFLKRGNICKHQLAVGLYQHCERLVAGPCRDCGAAEAHPRTGQCAECTKRDLYGEVA